MTLDVINDLDKDTHDSRQPLRVDPHRLAGTGTGSRHGPSTATWTLRNTIATWSPCSSGSATRTSVTRLAGSGGKNW
jgi:hypothetical protein